MKRLLKLCVMVLVLAAAGLSVAVLLIPVETYKKEAVARVKALTGRDLTIAGDVHVSLWPDIGVRLEKAALSNPPGYNDAQMLEVDSLVAEVALLPLLHGDLRVKRFVLDKPVIHLEIAANGVPNWEFSKQAVQAETNTGAAAPASNALPPVLLGKMKIKNGEFTYRDRRSGKVVTASGMDLDVAAKSPSSPLTVSGNVNWNRQRVEFSLRADKPRALLQNGESPFKAELKSGSLLLFTFDGRATSKNAQGTTEFRTVSLPKLAAWTGSSFSWKGQAPLAFGLHGDAVCSASGCAFAKADIALDDIRASGSLKAAWGGPVPIVEAKLATGKLDLNPYLPQSQKHASLLVSDAQAAEGWSTERIDLSGLLATNAVVSLSADGLLYGATELGKLTLGAQLTGGTLTLNVPSVTLYGGTAKLTATVTSANAISASLSASGVQVQPFLKDFAQFDRLSGTGAIQAQITGQGASQRDIVSSLGGKGDIRLTDGMVRGIDLASLIRNAKALVTGADTSAQKTDFSEMGGTFTIEKGIVKHDDFVMKAPLLRVKGAGTVDLPQRYVRYRLTPGVVGTAAGQGGKDKDGLGVPVNVEGSFEHLSFRPDFKSAIQQAIQNPTQAKAALKTIKKNLNPDSLKNLLNGLGR